MIVRLFFGALIAAFLAFMWGFVFWVVLDSGNKLMDPLPGEEAVVSALREAGLASGMYVYPAPADMKDEEATATHKEKHRAGPLLQLAYRANGGEPMPPEQYGKGYGHYFCVALILGILLHVARQGLPSYVGRVFFCVITGLLAAVWADWADSVWFFDPWSYTMGRTVEMLVTALIIGLVLAAFIKPTPGAQTM